MIQLFRRITFGAALAATATLAVGVCTASAATRPNSPVAPQKLTPYHSWEYGTSVTKGSITRGSLTVVADFHIPGAPAVQAGRARPMDSARNCADDSTYSYQSCLTQNFNACHISGNANVWVDLISYVQRWTLIDPSGDEQIRGPAGIRAGALGATNPKCGGSAIISSSVDHTISNPAPSTNYTLKPSWAGKYLGMSSATYQCANSYVQVYRVTVPKKSWTLETPDVCQGEIYSPS
jgi:hypothetical protein